VQRRGESSWRIRIYAGIGPDGRNRYVSRTVRGTRDDADRELARLLLEVGDGRHQGDESTTVAQLLEAWLPFAERDLAVTTRRDYRSCVSAHLKPRLGHVRLWQLRAVDLDRAYREMGEKVGPARVLKAHNIMRKALGQAVRWEWVATNVALSATPPSVTEKEIQPPSPELVRSLFEFAARQDPSLTTYIRLAAATCARRGGLVAIRWGDIDLDAGELAIGRARAVGGPGVGIVEKDTKAHATRRIALDVGTVTELREHRRRALERTMALGVRLADEAYVFAEDPEGRRVWRPDTASHRFVRISGRALLDDVRFHDLRHFVATQMLAAGEDPKTVAGRPGHKRVATMLDCYSHFVPARDRDAADPAWQASGLTPLGCYAGAGSSTAEIGHGMESGSSPARLARSNSSGVHTQSTSKSRPGWGPDTAVMTTWAP
jgi:integrase